MNLLESATELGRLRAAEIACFECLGALAPRLRPAPFALFAASASRAHAWRAALVEELLPVSDGLPSAAELTVAGGLLSEGLGLLAGMGRDPSASGGPTADGARVVSLVLERLYPELVAAYGSLLARCRPVSDGAVARNLRRALSDLEAVSGEGAALFATRS